MKTQSSSSNLIWTLTQTSFVLTLWVITGRRVTVSKRWEDWTPVGGKGELHDPHTGHSHKHKVRETGWTGQGLPKSLVIPRLKEMKFFLNGAHLPAKSEPVKVGQEQQRSREGGTEISPKVMRMRHRGWSKRPKMKRREGSFMTCHVKTDDNAESRLRSSGTSDMSPHLYPPDTSKPSQRNKHCGFVEQKRDQT